MREGQHSPSSHRQLLQHHINRANVKIANMKKRTLPTVQQQQDALERRKRDIFQAEEQPQLTRRSQKYFSHLTSSTDRFAANHGRIGVVIKDDNLQQTPAGSKRLLSGLLGGILGGGGGGVTPAQQPTTTAAVTSSSSSTSTSPTSTNTSAGKAVKTKGTSSTTAGNAKGFPQAALDAADSTKVQSAKAVTAQQSLGLDIEANDIGYIATIQVGSANTPFRMLIDSGSADTWVPSSSCTGCGQSHTKLGTKVSSSYKQQGSKFQITYGTGSVSGFLGADTLTIAGMKLKNHTIALTTKETTDFSDEGVPFDGLMGLAQQSLSNSNQPTPIDALYAAKLVPAPVMGYHLARASDNSNDGEVTFGGVDATKYTGDLVEIPNVSNKGFWEIPIEGVSFDGKSIAGLASKRTAILDTGTTLIVAPTKDADLIHAQIPGAKSDGSGGYTLPCTTTKQLSFTFGGQEWPLNSEDMIFLPVDDTKLDGDCISSISAGNVGGNDEWLLGASFVKNAYFATNNKANVVGLGRLK